MNRFNLDALRAAHLCGELDDVEIDMLLAEVDRLTAELAETREAYDALCRSVGQRAVEGVQHGDERARAALHSSLLADTPEELHEFAARLGLRRSWAQGTDDDPKLHYDVTEPRRRQAILLGAQEITWRDTARIVGARRAAIQQQEARQ